LFLSIYSKPSFSFSETQINLIFSTSLFSVWIIVCFYRDCLILRLDCLYNYYQFSIIEKN
jgi:hypothetical protein